jgi:hypothetical protein
MKGLVNLDKLMTGFGERFQWQKYVIAGALIFLWAAPLYSSFPYLNVYGKVVYAASLYVLTLFISRKVSAPVSGIFAFVGLAAATAVMLTLLVAIVANLPFPRPWAWLPQLTKFLYWLYPAVFGAVVTTVILFYPLTKLFGERSRFCAWGVVVIIFLFRYDAILHGKTGLHQLVAAAETFSIILLWFFALQLQKMDLRAYISGRKRQQAG